jgi:hypothetical protein
MWKSWELRRGRQDYFGIMLRGNQIPRFSGGAATGNGWVGVIRRTRKSTFVGTP